jgi:hypothetical protein
MKQVENGFEDTSINVLFVDTINLADKCQIACLPRPLVKLQDQHDIPLLQNTLIAISGIDLKIVKQLKLSCHKPILITYLHMINILNNYGGHCISQSIQHRDLSTCHRWIIISANHWLMHYV